MKRLNHHGFEFGPLLARETSKEGSVVSIKNDTLNESALYESQLLEAIQRIAGSECHVLVMGEPGVGKSAISELLHALSPRSGGVCQSLVASDADASRILSAVPGSGTLVLIAAADLSLKAQETLVRCYEKTAAESKKRLICTTRYDLAELVRDGRMREDFYYLVSAVTLRVPPLRHRRAELLTLAEQMLERYARQYDRPKPLLNAEIRAFLLKHTWPGNLAELETSMKTCVAIGDPDFSLAALKAASPRNKAHNGHRPISLKAATKAACHRVERQLIAEVLRATDGNRKQTAKELRISYKTLLYKLKQTGLSTRAASDGAAI